jgi:hypothetical protein
MYHNAQYKGSSNSEGNVAAYFETFEHLIAQNDGAHDYTSLTEDAHDNPAPFYRCVPTNDQKRYNIQKVNRKRTMSFSPWPHLWRLRTTG